MNKISSSDDRGSGEQANRRREELQVILVQSVLAGHLRAMEEAAKELVSQFRAKAKTTHPLNFICKKMESVPKRYSSHSPLMIALEERRTDIAEKLLEMEAAVAYKNKDGLTALHIACNLGLSEMVTKMLVAAKKQQQFCQTKRLKLKNDCEAVINAKERKWGWTALMYAAKNGHLECVKELVKDQFLKFDVKNKKMQNVLHITVREGWFECLKYLHTVNPLTENWLSRDKKKWSLLHDACTNSKGLVMIQWLLENIPQLKTELNQKSERGYTPLLVACEYQKLEVVKYLTQDPSVKHLVDVTACCHSDDGGKKNNGLHIAAIHNSVELAELLIEADCPLDAVDKDGNTILHIAHKRATLPSFISLVTKTCKEKKIDLETVKNQDGKLPNQVEEDIVIPLEILKMGEEAIKIYRKALDSGKQKIPYCSMLILGEQEVGKTSLYRQLVGKEFLKDLDSTRGIDNNTVDTVDRRNVDADRENWQEKKELEMGDEFANAVAREIKDDIDKLKPSKEDIFKGVSEHDLLARIEQIRAENNLNTAQSQLRRANRASRHQASTTISAAPPTVAASPAKKRKTAAEQPHPLPTRPPKGAAGSTDSVEQPLQTRSSRRLQKKPPIPLTEELPPLPPPEPSENHGTESVVGMLNRRQSDLIGNIVKSKKGLKKNHPSLVLNTLDFAGQKTYIPMHHCFISRRAIYIIVFKIPAMLEYCKNKDEACNNPLERVRYWIHSIHAHIYPPDEDLRKKDTAINRVFLVGTHLGGHSPDNLKEIDALIRENLIRDRRCTDHIHPTEKKDSPSFFIGVENSIDIGTRGDDYLTESGTKFLQERIKETSGKLPFLDEDHPIKWLKFEERLKKEGEERRPAPVMDIEQVKDLANKSRIMEEEEQDLALKFFHDTGKIIYLKYLPRLFLKEEEFKELYDLVILRPHWLISVMKVIMELSLEKNEEGVPQSKLLTLTEDGIADIDLLKECWKQYLPKSDSPSAITVHHLCLILQAYCLIYPVPLPKKATDCSLSSGNMASEDVVQQFIIPCKLPKDLDDKKCEMDPNYCCTFYFDFEGFLPEEIYHRLIFLVPKTDTPSECCYSNKRCTLWLMDTKWVFEIEKEKHRLKIMVIVPSSECKPVEYITFVHGHLVKICRDSGLKGLSYYAGIEVTCDVCKQVTYLKCTSYKDGCEMKNNFLRCSCSCPWMKEDVNELLVPQSMRYKISDEISDVLSTCPNLIELTVCFERGGIKVNLTEEVGTKYTKLGLLLLKDENGAKVEAWEREHLKNAEKINEVIFREWIKGEFTPVTWETLLGVLEKIGLVSIAKSIREGLCNNNNNN